MKECNLAVLGIGTLTAETSVYGREVLADRLPALQSQGFVGDLATNLVRPDGSWDSNPIQNRLMAADMETLRNIENVVAVAAGAEKASAVEAVLRSGCVNTLILDETTAKMLV